MDNRPICIEKKIRNVRAEKKKERKVEGDLFVGTWTLDLDQLDLGIPFLLYVCFRQILDFLLHKKNLEYNMGSHIQEDRPSISRIANCKDSTSLLRILRTVSNAKMRKKNL